MKKHSILLALVLGGAFSLNAQTGQGGIILGGTAGFNTQDSGDDKVTTVDLNPTIHYFLVDRLAVGAAFNISSLKLGEDKQSSFGFGPSVRYYLLPHGPAAIFAQAGFEYLNINYHSDLIDNASATGFGGGLGADIFLGDHVAVEGILAYNSQKVKDAADRTNGFGLKVGLVAFIGGGKD